MSTEKPHIFGIRHHGPGSARRLEEALVRLEPDSICIEFPKHIQSIIEGITPDSLTPPVAVLSYPPGHPDRGNYLPLTSYSPEFIAWRYAHLQGVPIYCIDLPFYMKQSEERRQLPLFSERASHGKDEEDPFKKLSEIAGMEDTETWWDNYLEREKIDSQEVFEVIHSLMDTLRPEPYENKSRLEERREAFMRLEIREACKTAERVAVVCGAWHLPALTDPFDPTIKEEKEKLKGFRKKKVQSVFIPWTYERLMHWSGYGAGIASPSWYQFLFDEGDDALMHWLAEAAAFLRSEGYDCPPSSVIEAVRFTRTLAGIRSYNRAGLKELEDATLTVLCEGKKARYEAVHEALILGDVIGSVPEQDTDVPLRKDFNQRVKKARLTRYMGTAERKERSLDLRKDRHLFASHFLHQCHLLDIPWGRRFEAPERALGSFHERWQLEWDPSIELKIIAAGTYGTTLPQAASNKITEEYQSGGSSLEQLAACLHRCLKADLQQIIPFLANKLQSSVAKDSDVLDILAGLSELIYARRYSSVRGFDTGVLDAVIDYSTPRLATGLAAALRGVDEEEAKETGQQINAVGHALPLLERNVLEQEWMRALRRVMHSDQISFYLRGTACHLLFSYEELTPKLLQRDLKFIFSGHHPPESAAHWLEGFLQHNATLLRMHPQLLRVIDEWLTALSEDQFTELLPMLRKTFSFLKDRERRLLLERLKGGLNPSKSRIETNRADRTGESEPVDVPSEYMQLIDKILGKRD